MLLKGIYLYHSHIFSKVFLIDIDMAHEGIMSTALSTALIYLE